MLYLKNEKGISFIALIIILVIIIGLVAIGIHYGKKQIETVDFETIKTDMISIKGKIKIISEKNSINSKDTSLQGIPLNLENNETGYEISEELKTKLAGLKKAKLYIIDQDTLNNNGLGSIKSSNTKFYIVDYTSCEVYYSLGYQGLYSLTEIEGL